MNTINNEILSSIDKIDQITLESEMNVLESLCDVYEKSCVIMENYEGDDLSCFEVFQEGAFKDAVNEAKGSKGEKLIKRILMFIPRLVSALIKQLKKFITNKKNKTVINDLEKVKTFEPATFKPFGASLFEKLQDVDNELDKMEADRDEIGINIQDRHDKAAEVINNALRNIMSPVDSGSISAQIDKNTEELEELLESMVEKKEIKTSLYFEQVLQLINHIRDEINALTNAFENTPVYEMNPKLDDILYEYGRHPIWNISGSESDVRSFLMRNNAKTYSIDEACDFIKGKTDVCKDLLNQVETMQVSVNRLLKKEEDRLAKNMKKGTPDHLEDAQYCKEDIATFNRILDILKSQTRVIPMIIKVINDEIETWDEAAKAILKNSK